MSQSLLALIIWMRVMTTMMMVNMRESQSVRVSGSQLLLLSVTSADLTSKEKSEFIGIWLK